MSNQYQIKAHNALIERLASNYMLKMPKPFSAGDEYELRLEGQQGLITAYKFEITQSDLDKARQLAAKWLEA